MHRPIAEAKPDCVPVRFLMSRGPFRDVEFISTTRRAQLACTSEPLFVPSAHALAYTPDYPSAKQNNNIAKGRDGWVLKALGRTSLLLRRDGRARQFRGWAEPERFRMVGPCAISLSFRFDSVSERCMHALLVPRGACLVPGGVPLRSAHCVLLLAGLYRPLAPSR